MSLSDARPKATQATPGHRKIRRIRPKKRKAQISLEKPAHNMASSAACYEHHQGKWNRGLPKRA
jgi:hypothetical protein